jgi:hypothetical protein
MSCILTIALGESRRPVLLPLWVFTKLRQHTVAANDDFPIAPDWLEDLPKACEDLSSIPILRHGTSASLGPQKLNGRYFKADLASFQSVYGSGGMILCGTLLLRDFEAYKESLTGQAKCSLPTSEDIERALVRYKMVETIRADLKNRCCYNPFHADMSKRLAPAGKGPLFVYVQSPWSKHGSEENAIRLVRIRDCNSPSRRDCCWLCYVWMTKEITRFREDLLLSIWVLQVDLSSLL